MERGLSLYSVTNYKNLFKKLNNRVKLMHNYVTEFLRYNHRETVI